MPKGPTKRRPQTLARLLEAAIDVFGERGYYGASIEDICDRAGFTRGAFYSNFKTKDELFFALFDQHAEREIERLAEMLAEMENASDPLDVLDMITRVDEEQRRWYLVSTEFSLHAMRHPDTARALAEHDRQLRVEIARLLGLVFERAGRRPTVDLDRLARLLVAIREGGMLQSYVEPDVLPPGELEREFLPAVLQAVSTE